ncbi:hypothetical protein EDC02_4061 [Micromonospora sp. Llam0]|nr:hypothetical protein EDC02_4061 [Micromonospora sp. Llam0]
MLHHAGGADYRDAGVGLCGRVLQAPPTEDVWVHLAGAYDPVSGQISVYVIRCLPWILRPSGRGGNGLLWSRTGKVDSPPGRIDVQYPRTGTPAYGQVC